MSEQYNEIETTEYKEFKRAMSALNKKKTKDSKVIREIR